jgi:exonuclease SbcD
VTIVDASPGRPAVVREFHLTKGRRLLDIAGSIDELERNAGAAGDAFLRVAVRTGGPVPGLVDRVRELLPNAVDIRLDYERSEQPSPTQSLSRLTPRDQFRAYHLAEHGTEPDSSALGLFDEVFAEATQDA